MCSCGAAWRLRRAIAGLQVTLQIQLSFRRLYIHTYIRIYIYTYIFILFSLGVIYKARSKEATVKSYTHLLPLFCAMLIRIRSSLSYYFGSLIFIFFVFHFILFYFLYTFNVRETHIPVGETNPHTRLYKFPLDTFLFSQRTPLIIYSTKYHSWFSLLLIYIYTNIFFYLIEIPLEDVQNLKIIFKRFFYIFAFILFIFFFLIV